MSLEKAHFLTSLYVNRVKAELYATTPPTRIAYPEGWQDSFPYGIQGNWKPITEYKAVWNQPRLFGDLYRCSKPQNSASKEFPRPEDRNCSALASTTTTSLKERWRACIVRSQELT